MLPEIGHFSLILALFVAGLQCALPLAGTVLRAPALAQNTRFAALLLFLLVSLAFAALIGSYALSDFSVLNVIANSHSDKPLFFKISAAWGNHEGSMLLWIWVLALFGALLARARGFRRDEALRTLSLAVQGLVAVGFVAFVLFTSNPFARVFPPPANGEDLNPLLQDVGLALHPPCLYLGYVGFSIVYSMAVAALLQGRMESRWATLARPWILFTWSVLTVGIALGSWWAYRELGWGGWWFWDPVENASLMPWLAATALLHCNLMLERRGVLKNWVLLLAILTFSLSVMGTFLVRSGLLTSVHSFASDPARGLFILAYMAVITGGALLLYALRAGRIDPVRALTPLSREGAIVINNLFLLTGCGVIVLATLYPLIMEWATGAKISVGAPYFNATFLPLMAPMLLLAGVGPLLSWSGGGLHSGAASASLAARLRPAFAAAAALAALAAVSLRPHWGGALACGALSGWIIGASLVAVRERRGHLLRQSASFYGMVLAHLGVGVLVAGIGASALGRVEVDRNLTAGDTVQIGPFEARMQHRTQAAIANYRTEQTLFAITRGGSPVAMLQPEYRFYPVRGSHTSEADIHATPFYDFYAVTGATQDGNTATRFYYIPMMSAVWAGAALMAAGGGVSAALTLLRAHRNRLRRQERSA